VWCCRQQLKRSLLSAAAAGITAAILLLRPGSCAIVLLPLWPLLLLWVA
jgi:hypothetical protein